MNNVCLTGNLSTAPKLLSGKKCQYCSFTLAVDRSRSDERADHIRINVFDARRDACMKYLSKGSLVAVEGSIVVAKEKGEHGKEVTVYSVKARNVDFLDMKHGAEVTQAPEDFKIPDVPQFDPDVPQFE